MYTNWAKHKWSFRYISSDFLLHYYCCSNVMDKNVEWWTYSIYKSREKDLSWMKILTYMFTAIKIQPSIIMASVNWFKIFKIADYGYLIFGINDIHDLIKSKRALKAITTYPWTNTIRSRKLDHKTVRSNQLRMKISVYW